MARMAVVGCEGSGKTVFMAALADYYRPDAACGVCLVPENSASNRFAALQQRQMRALHQWPPATNPEKTVRLDWTLRRDGETLVEIGMLEFGGETFRAAFRGDGDEATKATAVRELVSYLSDADIVVVLVSIKDLMRDQGSLSAEEFERDAEALWVTRGIIDFIARERPSAGVVIGLTRADQYRAELDAAGGASALFSARWPTVGAAAAKIPIVEVASVSAVDDAGMPAEGYRTDGILPAMREVSKMRYGDVKGILAELSALEGDLRRPEARKSFEGYSSLLRKFSDRFDDLKAAAAISSMDVAHETEGLASSLNQFRAESEALAREEERLRERRRHPRVRRSFLVAFIFAAALFAVSPILPFDRLIAKVAERIEQSRRNVVAIPPPVETNAVPPAAATNEPPVVAETNAVPVAVMTNTPPVVAAANVPPVIAETNAVPEVVVTNAPPVAIETNAVPVVAEANAEPAVVNASSKGAETKAPTAVAAPVAAATEPPRKEPPPVVSASLSDAAKALVVFSNRLERAKAGDLKCKRWLGNQYYKGTDTAPRNLVMARHWYREAAEGGDARAQACLAVMCEYGEGGPLLPSEAMSWYRKAAEGGVAEAMFRLGVNLWEGAVDDPKAAREAYDWMLKAKAAGCQNEDLDAWIRKATPRDR